MAPTNPRCCEVCGTETSKICSKCSEGLNMEGNTTPTYYCGVDCQRAAWKAHKIECRAANDRKLLYRGGNMLQDLFYHLREVLFDNSIEKVVKKGNQLTVYETTGDYATKQHLPFWPLPREGLDEDHDKAAVLTYWACSDATYLLNELIERLSKDICDPHKDIHEVDLELHDESSRVTRVQQTVFKSAPFHQVFEITLRDGHKYIMDLAGAQYGQYKAVMPDHEFNSIYRAKRFNEHPFSHSAAFLQKVLDRRNRQFVELGDFRVAILQNQIVQLLKAVTESWETASKTTVAGLLDVKENTLALLCKDFVEALMSKVKIYIGWWASPEGPKLVKRLDGEKYSPTQNLIKWPKIKKCKSVPAHVKAMFENLKLDPVKLSMDEGGTKSVEEQRKWVDMNNKLGQMMAEGASMEEQTKLVMQNYSLDDIVKQFEENEISISHGADGVTHVRIT